MRDERCTFATIIVLVAVMAMGGSMEVTASDSAQSAGNEANGSASSEMRGSGKESWRTPWAKPRGRVFFRPPGGGIATPDLRNLERGELSNVAEVLGIEIQTWEASSSQPKGRVFLQTPEAGTLLRKQRLVIVKVSGGLDVPDLHNQSSESATESLSSVGLRWEIRDVTEPSYPVGSVVRQHPGPGTILDASRDRVILEIADNRTRVPALEGQMEADALEMLKAHHLNGKFAPESFEEITHELCYIVTNGRKARNTTPGAGSIVGRGDTIAIEYDVVRVGEMDNGSCPREMDDWKMDDCWPRNPDGWRTGRDKTGILDPLALTPCGPAA